MIPSSTSRVAIPYTSTLADLTGPRTTPTSINPENGRYKLCWNVRDILVLLCDPPRFGKWFQQVLLVVSFIKLPYFCVIVSDVSSFKGDVTIAFLCFGCRLYLGTWPDTCHLHKADWLLHLILVRVFVKLHEVNWYRRGLSVLTGWWILIKLVLWRWARLCGANWVFVHIECNKMFASRDIRIKLIKRQKFVLVLEVAQPLTEMSIRNISWGVKAAGE